MNHHSQNALGGIEEFDDFWDVEPLLEPVPHVRAHTIAVHGA